MILTAWVICFVLSFLCGLLTGMIDLKLRGESVRFAKLLVYGIVPTLAYAALTYPILINK